MEIETHYNPGTREHYMAIENGHAYLLIRIDIGLVSRIDAFDLVME
jgi:hypothetical protein